MRDFEDAFETRKQSLVSAFSVFMTVPLKDFSIKKFNNKEPASNYGALF